MLKQFDNNNFSEHERKPESRFKISFRKTEPTSESESENRKSVFHGFPWRFSKPKVHANFFLSKIGLPTYKITIEL
jgi:hypothetical protein